MKKLTLIIVSFCCFIISSYSQDIGNLKLKDYRPKPIHKVPVTDVKKAKFPVIDMHSHAYTATEQDVEKWVQVMDEVGIEKTIILSFFTGAKFDSVYNIYSKYGARFEIWCGLDYTGYPADGWENNTVKELERCYKIGARGVGELGDKGPGEMYSSPVQAKGLHIDDPALKPVLKKCADLKMPVNIHVAEPFWMYHPMDSTNDGLINAYLWQVDTTAAGVLGYSALIKTLENAVKDNPETTFIACHFANSCYNLEVLGKLLDTYDNLYADISARYGETAAVPRYMTKFYEKYADKLLYGTDMGTEAAMYQFTFRILESNDEHFYDFDRIHYHWPCHGFGLSDKVLKKLYRTNALKILAR